MVPVGFSHKDRARKIYWQERLSHTRMHHPVIIDALEADALQLNGHASRLCQGNNPQSRVINTWPGSMLETESSCAGEIIPQAACKSYGLAIGAWCAPLVRVLMFLVIPIGWPISKVLDYCLGEDHGVNPVNFHQSEWPHSSIVLVNPSWCISKIAGTSFHSEINLWWDSSRNHGNRFLA